MTGRRVRTGEAEMPGNLAVAGAGSAGGHFGDEIPDGFLLFGQRVHTAQMSSIWGKVKLAVLARSPESGWKRRAIEGRRGCVIHNGGVGRSKIKIKIKSKSKSRQEKPWERGSESGNSPNELSGYGKAHPERSGQPPEASFASSSERTARSVNSQC